MRIDVSRLKYLGFVLALGGCFFDPKATGAGTGSSPIIGNDASVVLDGASGTGGTGGTDTIGTGVGGMSVGAAGRPASTSGSGGAAPDGGLPPTLLENGVECADDARCQSGHCDIVCCDKGSECCRDVADCTTKGGLGMSCDDRSMCRGSSGKITCTSDHRCVTVDGARNDTACSNRTEANDCGVYPSVFCLGGELQSGAPPCATSCASDDDCDTNAHCADGKCEEDKPNGDKCTRNQDCAAGICKNMVEGAGQGICCNLGSDCCATADDCPAKYRTAAKCDDATMCKGSETVAMCLGNVCSSMTMAANSACDGMKGSDCGFYQDVVCMAARSNVCRTTCMSNAECDATAFCGNRMCQAKKENGNTCGGNMECANNNCNNGVCCSMNGECCKTANDCKLGLDPKCDKDPLTCQGTLRQAVCQPGGLCRYMDRIDDDRACTAGPMTGQTCGNFKPLQCTGMTDQTQLCKQVCMSNADCNPGSSCVENNGAMRCLASGGSGPGNGNGNGSGNN